MKLEKDYNCIVKFDRNYNSKLSCEAFSTVRKTDNKKYEIGRNYMIMLCDYHSQMFHEIGEAVLVAKQSFKPSGLTDSMSYLDAGMRSDSLMRLLLDLYKHDIWDTDECFFSMYIFKFTSKTYGW